MRNENRLHISGDHIGLGLAFISALFIVYLTFPSFVTSFFPNVQSDLLWRSPLAGVQSFAVISGLIFIGFSLALVNAVKRMKYTGGLQIPLWLIVTVFTIFSVLISVLIMMVAFSLTFEVLTSFGVGSAVVAVVAFLAALIAAYLLR